MKLIALLIIVSSFSVNALATDKIEDAKQVITKAVENTFSLGNWKAPKESRFIEVSPETFDTKSLECVVNVESEIACAITAQPEASNKYKIKGLYVFVSSDAQQILGFGVAPLDSDK